MKNNMLTQHRLLCGLLIASQIGLAGPGVASETEAPSLSAEVKALLASDSGQQSQTVAQSEALTDALYALGWSEEKPLQPHVQDLDEDLATQTALHQSLTDRGYQFTALDCELTDWLSVAADQIVLTEDFSSHACLDGLKNKPFGTDNQAVTLLLSADVMADVMADDQPQKAQSILSIESTLGSTDWVSRDIEADNQVAIQREWFALSSACQDGPCDMGVVLRGLSADTAVKLNLQGVYTGANTGIKSSTFDFENGDFSAGSQGWGWQNRNGSFTCFSGFITPRGRSPVDIRTDPQTGNPHAAAGGFAATFSEGNVTFSSQIAQTVQYIPPNASIDFRYNLFQGTRWDGEPIQNGMRVVAYDFSTGQPSVIYSKSINKGSTGWTPVQLDLSAYATKRVQFRFETCSTAISESYPDELSYHGLLFLDDVALSVEEPPAPSGQFDFINRCRLVGNNSTCTTQLPWQTENTQVACVWHADGAVDLLSCSNGNQGTAQFHDTTTMPTNVVLKNHATPPSNTLADYMTGSFLDVEVIQALPPSTATGELTSNSPCELPIGGSQCTVRLDIEAENTPINCLWTTSPNLRLVSCSAALDRHHDWIYANTTGHYFELRGHDSYPQQTNADYLSGVYLSSELVYAIPNQSIAPDTYDNVSIRGYDDDSPGDAVVLFAGETAQSHNFHDAGDQDWTIFALGPGQGVQVSTSPTGSIAAKMVAYVVTGAYTEIAPGRWDIGLNDLTQVTSDTSSGNNSVTIVNNTTVLRVYVIKTYGSQHGNGSAYHISSTGM